MFVRTDPRDNTRRVTTAQGAQDIDDERAKRDGSWEFIKAKRDRETATREKLAKKWNMSPDSVDSHDVEWSILNEDAMEAMKHQNWLDYTIVRWDMASALRDRGSLDQAAPVMLQACYLSMNGPNDMFPQGVDMTSVYKPFQPELDRDRVSVELRCIREVFDRLNLSIEEGLEKFGDRAEHESCHLPISWQEARELIRSWLSSPNE
jgi:hypothetical protein